MFLSEKRVLIKKFFRKIENEHYKNSANDSTTYDC